MTALTGTAHLIRLALRRDRVILPLWIVAIAALPPATAASFVGLYPDEQARTAFAVTMGATPSLTALYGPLFGTGLGALVTWRTSMELVMAALAVGLTVIRHTRAEEEQGRRELLGATVVGRVAGLAAALAVGGAASVLLGLLVGLFMAGAGVGGVGAVAIGLQYAVIGCLFAAVAGLAAQLTQGARAARWIVGGALIGSLLLRIAGDAGGAQNSVLSWLSPIGLVHRLRPYAGERWWVAAVVMALAVLVGAAAYAMTARRDLDAGLLASRPGPARAAGSLRSPLALAWRLQRGGLLGWIIGFTVVGVIVGSAAKVGSAAMQDNTQLAAIMRRVGGETVLADIMVSVSFAIVGIAAAAQGIQALLRGRAEEVSGRLEPLLATAVGRVRWAGGYLLFALGGPVLTLAAAGLATGIGYGASVGDVGGQLPRILAAALVQLPAVWVTVAITVALFGLAPRLIGAGWAVLAGFLLLGQLGAMLQFSQWALDLSPYTHLPRLPGGEVGALPLVWLTLVAAALAAAGTAGFRRRDIG